MLKLVGLSTIPALYNSAPIILEDWPPDIEKDTDESDADEPLVFAEEVSSLTASPVFVSVVVLEPSVFVVLAVVSLSLDVDDVSESLEESDVFDLSELSDVSDLFEESV